VVVTSSQQAVQLLGCGLGHTILTSLAGWQAGRGTHPLGQLHTTL
jgi:hypothetical protein